MAPALYRSHHDLLGPFMSLAVGFGKATAKVTISQYESGARIPKEKMKATLASALRVSPETSPMYKRFFVWLQEAEKLES